MSMQLPPILGEDTNFLDAIEHCSRLAVSDKSCLVVGERGSGKEIFAARLHFLSPRWNGPLVKVNCGALSETLLETELFGHEAGAFTGAQRRHAGRFERADGGALFMDEIASASAAVQEKVLRVIEYGEFERVGGSEPLRVDVRVIGAANLDLPALAAKGKFRADLLDRIAFDVITIPPLRSRPGDILLLAKAFAMEITRSLGRSSFSGFSTAAAQTLLAHPWPGNVRELRNVVERAVFYAEDGALIEAITIDPFASPWRPGQTAGAASGVEAATVPRATEAAGGYMQQVADYEKRLLSAALAACKNHQKNTAQRLGLSYHQLRRLLKKHQLG